jgi:hypothetical protein
MKVSRRSFLKSSAAAGAAVAASGGLVQNVLASAPAMTPGPGNKWPGRVAINFNKNVVTNVSTGAIDQTIAKKMIDDSIKMLTGESSVGAAWKAIFPSSLNASSKIAIKVPLGCAVQTVAPHWSTVKAIVDGLLSMDLNGSKIPENNITIWDMQCNNRLNTYGYNTTNFPGLNVVYDTLGTGYTDGARSSQYAKSLNTANFIINVFRPGGHSGYAEGLTLGFKNHYGSYPINVGQPLNSVAHANTEASLLLRDINCTGPVFNKTVLSICVGLFGAAEASNNPGSSAVSYATYAKTVDSSITTSSFAPSTIIISTDPVSAEMQTIKMMRLNKNPAGGYAVADMPKYLRASGGISGALTGTTYNIGQIEEDPQKTLRIINEVVMTRQAPSVNTKSGATIWSFPIQGHNSTFIEFTLPHNHVGRDALLELYDIKGALVRRYTQKVLGATNHFSWNNKDASGKQVSLGTYVVRLTSGNICLSSWFSTMR